MHAKEITDAAEKSALCDTILHALPHWFEIEASITEYVERVRGLPFFAAMSEPSAVGFLAIKPQNQYTAEFLVMGVLQEYQRQGAGKALVAAGEEYCRAHGFEFLTGKTLDASREDAYYEQTRRFHFAMGFRPLEVFPLFWDEENPCLFLAKYIGGPYVSERTL